MNAAQEKLKITDLMKFCASETAAKEAAEAERDRAVRALKFLKSYNRGIYDCAIRMAEEPVPVPAPQTCPTCGHDVRCIHGIDFRDKCETCEAIESYYEAGPAPTKEAPLEPGEFYITRGDGVQERCRYSGKSITIPAGPAPTEEEIERDQQETMRKDTDRMLLNLAESGPAPTKEK